MKHYFIDRKEVTEEEAMRVEAQNMEYLNSGNFEDLLKCEYIIVGEW